MGRKAWENNTDRPAGSYKIDGIKRKDLIGIPWRVAFALQGQGWYLRADIIWNKPNPMPESVKDRPTKAHEYIFFMTKNDKYYYNADAIREKIAETTAKDNRRGWYKAERKERGSPQSKQHGGELLQPNEKGANKRTVWTIATQPFSGVHFAVFPEKLIESCILAGCPENGIIYDPFGGMGTTAKVALRAKRKFILSELNTKYCEMTEDRIKVKTQQYEVFE